MKSVAIPQIRFQQLSKPNKIKRKIFNLDKLLSEFTNYLIELGKDKPEVQQNIMTVLHFVEWYEYTYRSEVIFDNITMVEFFSYLNQFRNKSIKNRLEHLKGFWDFLQLSGHKANISF